MATETYNTARDAHFIFRFLGDIWSKLPLHDKRILSNFWAGLIKVTGDLQIKAYEKDMSTAVLDVPVYNVDRWSAFQLDSTTAISPSPSPDPLFQYSYFLGDSLIVSIPVLQDQIDIPAHTLVQGTDFIVTNNMIHFKLPPSTYFFKVEKPFLWAPSTLLNKNIPYRNFGCLIDLFRDNSS